MEEETPENRSKAMRKLELDAIKYLEDTVKLIEGMRIEDENAKEQIEDRIEFLFRKEKKKKLEEYDFLKSEKDKKSDYEERQNNKF